MVPIQVCLFGGLTLLKKGEPIAWLLQEGVPLRGDRVNLREARVPPEL